MGRTQLSTTILHSVFREKTFGASNNVRGNKKTLQKKYWALVIGSPRRREGLISVPLIKADLERVYDETIRDGSDESTANSIAIEKVIRKSKGLGIKIATTIKSSKSRFSSIPPEVQMEMNSMKEQMQLKDEKMERLEGGIERNPRNCEHLGRSFWTTSLDIDSFQ